MIRSMTGYGRAERLEGGKKISVEMKSVNHRYLDVSLRLPRRFSMYDASLRTRLKQYVSRGKLEICVAYENNEEEKQSLRYNAPLAAAYREYIRQMAEAFQLPDNLQAATLARFPDVFTLEESTEETEDVKQLLFTVFGEAGRALVKNREAEGERLRLDLSEKAALVQEKVAAIAARSPEVLSEYRKRLQQKAAELLGDTAVDENRLAMEIVLYADKICTDEEIVRLKSHGESLLRILADRKEEAVGRKLDFLVQEMNREANTILSKANDTVVSEYGILLKTEIEKIREQVQNIE